MSVDVVSSNGRGASRRRPVVPSGVLAMTLFVVAEAMMFAGLISAFVIVRAQAPGGLWPPPGQPRLPAEETLLNTAFLLASGALLFVGGRAFKKGSPRAAQLVLASIVLGALFVVAQGVEWVALLREGLTMTSSAHGSFFYLIVGMHGLHAVVALFTLMWVFARLVNRRLLSTELWAAQVLWGFVVLVWPVLYARVYF